MSEYALTLFPSYCAGRGRTQKTDESQQYDKVADSELSVGGPGQCGDLSERCGEQTGGLDSEKSNREGNLCGLVQSNNVFLFALYRADSLEVST
jgi:hypothetical protein